MGLQGGWTTRHKPLIDRQPQEPSVGPRPSELTGKYYFSKSRPWSTDVIEKKKMYLPYRAPPSDSEPEAEVKSKPRHVHTNTEWFLYTVGVDYFIHFHWTETGSCFCSTFITVWFCFQFSSHSIYLTNKSYVFNPRWWITDFTEPLLPSFFFKAAVPLPPPSPFLPPSVPLCPWWKPTVTCWYLPSSSWHTFIPAVSHRDRELCVCVCVYVGGGREEIYDTCPN